MVTLLSIPLEIRFQIDVGVIQHLERGKPVPLPKGEFDKLSKNCRSTRLEICILGDSSTSTARLQQQFSSQIKGACDVFLVEMLALREIALEWLDLWRTDCLTFQLPCLEPLRQLANALTVTVGHSDCPLRKSIYGKVVAEGLKEASGIMAIYLENDYEEWLYRCRLAL